MRTNEEFIGEIKRRSIAYKEKQKKKRRIIMSCIPLILCFACIVAVHLRIDHVKNTSDGAEDVGAIMDGATATLFARAAVISDHPALGDSFTVEDKDKVHALENAVRYAIYYSSEMKSGEISGYAVTFTMSNSTTESYIISNNAICFNGNTYVVEGSYISEIERLVDICREEVVCNEET